MPDRGALEEVVQRYLPVIVGIGLFLLLLQLVPALESDRAGPARLQPFSEPAERPVVTTPATLPVGGSDVGGEVTP